MYALSSGASYFTNQPDHNHLKSGLAVVNCMLLGTGFPPPISLPIDIVYTMNQFNPPLLVLPSEATNSLYLKKKDYGILYAHVLTVYFKFYVHMLQFSLAIRCVLFRSFSSQ